MQLLTEELREALPPLYAQEKNDDPWVYCKFFAPDSTYFWYVLEGQQEEDDYLLFAYVIGAFGELGYVSLNELETTRGPWGLAIERDLYFTPGPLSKVKEEHYRI